MTDRVYCHGDLVTLRIVDDWYVCGGCGHDLWPVDATFAVDPERKPSGHGYHEEKSNERETQGEPEASVVSGGAAEAPDA